MKLDLAGTWTLRMEQDKDEDGLPEPAVGTLTLPGSLQAAGYGYPVHARTEWVSGLHNPFWHEREEYSRRPEDREDVWRVPFLAQPSRHFVGKAWYEREFTVTEEMAGRECWTLFIERTQWRSEAYVDGVRMGGDCSLCAPHEIVCGRLAAGRHRLQVAVDNSMQYAYRPDGHGVSDALGATWNGMVGEIALLSGEEMERRRAARMEYAKTHPRDARIRDGRFMIDGRAEYFRGTHFGGDYPLTGHPVMERAWWDRIMRIVKEWGLNFIRCHSYCPPEAAFSAADEAGVYLQPECGMWNFFSGSPCGEESLEPDASMYEVLQAETVRILKNFGHHPSFVLFSPTNEPGGDWYATLKAWVRFARRIDEGLGYGGRRLYTAQSGWFYDVPPAEVTREDTDYLYFHRSAYGPIFGGKIRGEEGWRGGDYNPSLEGAKLPAICHELGQWCSYPDYDIIINKYTGFRRPGSLELFRENARASGVLGLAGDFAYCSGRNQLRMYKEDVEANLRTEHLYGFELLDLHDYMGQGTALVGLLDAFWEEKGAVRPAEFREFCGETVALARLSSYVYRRGDTLAAPVEVCHFGREELTDVSVTWRLWNPVQGEPYASGGFRPGRIPAGQNTSVGEIAQSLDGVCGDGGGGVRLLLEIELEAAGLSDRVKNHWDIYVYGALCGEGGASVLDTHDFARARQALERGETVIFRPRMSDLDYDCPPVCFRNSFWNDQMGPGWMRGLGLSIQEGHPIFREFPTDHDGGWQWEEILSYARGFGLREHPGHQPLVRVVDEWNRNLPMGILLEAQVLNGRLLLVSADLETDAQERPAARALNRAIVRYARSGQYARAQTLPVEAVEDRLFPLLRSGERITGVRFGEALGRPDVQGYAVSALTDRNLNTTAVFTAKRFPIEVVLTLREPLDVEGIYYAPPQKDRMFEGCIRDYEVECLTPDGWAGVLAGTFGNSLFAQKARFPEKRRMVSALKLRVLSCYGQGEKTVWEETEDGWRRGRRAVPPQAQFAALHVITDGGSGHDDVRFWRAHTEKTTREIED